MKKYLPFLFFFSTLAFSQFYFGSNEAVNLTNRLKFKNRVSVEASSTSPTSGNNLATGSLVLKDDGTAWLKQYGATTSWARIATASEIGSYVSKTAESVETMAGILGVGAVQATGSAGFLIKNSSGNDVALFGAGPGTGVTTYDGLTTNGQTKVDGSSNTTQFIVEGFSGQTASMSTWQNSSGVTLVSIDSSGDLRYPDVTGSASDPQISFQQGANRTGIAYNGSGLILSVNSNAELTIGSSNSTFNGVLLAEDGTVDNPSYSFTGDTNTGVYWVSADRLGVTTGGVNRAIFDSNGITINGGLITSGGATISNFTGFLKGTNGAISTGSVVESLNGLTEATQTFATGSSGGDFNISSSGSIHTFNIPTASNSARGALSETDWTTFNNKVTGQSSSVDNEVALFSGTGGKTIKRASESGIPILTSGVLSVATGTNAKTLRATGSTYAFEYPGQNIASASNTYSVLSTDDVVYLNGNSAGFTATLPAISGLAGKIITIKKTDSTFNIITIEGNGSETIDDSLNKTLNTYNESITLIANNTGWVIQSRNIPTTPTSYSPTTFGLGTLTGSAMYWHREQQYIVITGKATTGTAAGDEARINLPSGITSNTVSSGIEVCGVLGYDNNNASSFYNTIEDNVTYMTFTAQNASTNGLTKLTGSGIGTGRTLSFNCRVRVVGWDL